MPSARGAVRTRGGPRLPWRLRLLVAAAAGIVAAWAIFRFRHLTTGGRAAARFSAQAHPPALRGEIKRVAITGPSGDGLSRPADWVVKCEAP
jgi:hypothetical protein